MRPTAARNAGPYSVRVPGPGMATGQPRVHRSRVQLVSKYPRADLAFGPKSLSKLLRVSRRRAVCDSRMKPLAASPPTKPNSTPGRPFGGESSNVAETGPFRERAVPLRPSLRQNGSSYTAATLSREACGKGLGGRTRPGGRKGQ